MKKGLIVSLAILLASVIAPQSLLAQKETLKKGLDAFAENDYTEAKKQFTIALNNPSTKADASLGLFFIDWLVDKEEDAFVHYLDYTKSAPDPYVYQYVLWRYAVQTMDMNSDLKKYLESLINDPKCPLYLKTVVQTITASNYFSKGDFEKSTSEYAKVGVVNNWQVVGSFDNSAGSGFDKDYGALAHPEKTYQFRNRYDAPVYWFDLVNAVSPDGMTIDLSNSFSNSSVAYAQSFIESPTDQELILQAGVTGSLKLWLNDQLVFSDQDEKSMYIGSYRARVKLNKGYNRILVQVGNNKVRGMDFTVRFVDVNEQAPVVLTAIGNSQPYKKGTTEPVKLPSFTVEFCKKQVQADSTNLLKHLLLGYAELNLGMLTEVKSTLSKARTLAPKNTLVTLQLIDLYKQDENESDLTKQIEFLKQTDPDSRIALLTELNDLSDREEYEEVRQKLEKVVKLYGTSYETELIEIGLMSHDKKYVELFQKIDQLYAKYPDVYYINYLKYLAEKEKKNTLGAIKMFEAYTKNNFAISNKTFIANEYLEMDNFNKAIKIYVELGNQFPYYTNLMERIANIYKEKQQYDQALIWINKALVNMPYSSRLWEAAGDMLMQMGKKAEMKEAYEKALVYDPNDYDLRTKLRELAGKPDLRKYFPTIDAYAIYKEENKKGTKYNNDDRIAILHDESQRIIYPEGKTESNEVLVVKVLNEDGIELMKEYSIGYDGYYDNLIIDKAEVLKPDGNKITGERDGNSIVFTNLEIGDGVYIAYRRQKYSYGKLANHFEDSYQFTSFDPILKTRYSLLVPKNFKFNYKVVHGDDLQPTIKSVSDEYDLYIWQLDNAKQHKFEKYMPFTNDVATKIYISSYPNWEFVANWYAELSNVKAKADFEVKEALKEIFPDSKQRTELEKARAIYNYIQKNIKYSSVAFRQSGLVPQKAAKTLVTKLGDCKDLSTLFVTMANEVGLKSQLVLCSTAPNGTDFMPVPSTNFNHCIVRVEADGKTYYVELTDNKLSFGALSSNLNHALVLEVPNQAFDKVPTTVRQYPTTNTLPYSITRVVDLNLSGKNMIVKGIDTKYGEAAARNRSYYTNLSQQDKITEFSSGISDVYKSTPSVKRLEFDMLQDLTDSVIVKYDLEVSNSVSEVAGMQIITLPWIDHFNNTDVISKEEREHTLVYDRFSSSTAYKQVITLNLGKELALVEKPVSEKFSCNQFDYSVQFQIVGEKLIATREFKVKDDYIPVSDYPAFRDFMKKVAESDQRQIALKKKI